MKVSEVRSLNSGDLAKRLEESHKELFNLRFRLSTKQLVNHRELPRVRKDIALIKTVMKERELGIERSEAVKK